MKIGLIVTAVVAAGFITAAGGPAVAEQRGLWILAQAETSGPAIDPVAQAEQEVRDARAILRSAMAGNGNVREARRALRRALGRLELARANPNQPLPPLEPEAGETEITEAPPEEAPVEELPLKAPPEQVVETDDDRVIVRRGSQLEVQHDDTARLAGDGGQRTRSVADDGTTTTTVVRPNGVRIVTVRAPDGEIIRRTRQGRNGRTRILIDTAAEQTGPALDLRVDLPRLEVRIPQQEYIVESERASDRQLEQALLAPPVEQVERAYSLREIRSSGRLRNKLRRIDVDAVTFEFGSADIPRDQVRRMERIGWALERILRRDPDEIILVEGHTDAVGTDLANLALSDRRAESVAYVLTAYFNVPPENLITQGYGEHFLKVPTAGPERQNRRVTLRRITPLLHGGDF